MTEKLRILLLEDDADDADIIQWELKKGNLSFDSLVVDNQPDFENALNTFHPDIILSDHALPVFNSIEALKLTRSMEVKIPFILITGNVSEEFAVSSMKAGADDYILKDRLQRLPSAIQNAMEKYRMANEKIIADQLVRNSDANLQAIMNNTTDCIFSVDRDFLLLSFNKAYSDIILAFTGETITVGGPFILQNTNTAVLNEWKEYIQSALEGKQFITETSYTFSEKEFFFEVSVNPIRRGEEIIGVGCFARDITERKHAEQKLQMSEHRFRSLIENNYDGIILRDKNFSIIYRSPSAIRILGWTTEEDTANPAIIAHPDDVETINQGVQDLLQHKAMSVTFTFRKRHKSGHYIWVQEVIRNLLHDKSVNAYVSNFRDITEQKEAEEKLKESESRFRALTENNYDGIVLLDEAFSIQYMSPAANKILGRTPEDGPVTSLISFVHPDDAEILSQGNRAVLQSKGKPVTWKFRMRHKAGHYIWSQGVKTNMLHDNSVKAIICNFRDVTDQVEADEKLKESELKFRALMENSNDGIILRDETLAVMYRNPAAARMVGWKEEENNTQSLLVSSHPDDLEIINKGLQEVIENVGKPVPMTFRTRHKDGHYIWIEGVITNMLHDKNVKAFVTNFRDITERVVFQNALQQSEERYRQILETAQEGIWAVDEFNITSFVNKNLCEILGHSPEEMIGKPAFDFMNAEVTKVAATSIERWKEGIRENYEFIYTSKTGKKIWVNITANPILSPEGKYKGALAMVTDITERKLNENKLRKSEAALAEAQKVARYGNWNFDFLTDELTWSDELYNVFGANKETFLETHQSFLHLIDEKDRDFAFQASLYTQMTGEPFSIDYNITTPKGEQRIIHEYGYAECDANGKVIRLYGTAQDVTESKKAEIELNELNEQLRKLSGHLQLVREEERTIIAREVHDELGQQMTSLKMDINALKNKYEETLPDIGIKANSMLEMVNEAIRTVRRIVTALRPGILDDLGLEAAIEWQAKDFEKRTGITCIFNSSLQQETFSPQINITVFRIFQESLTNVMRHAKATQVIANLNEDHSFLVLEVIDNGIGISDARKKNKTSFGLLGMKERAAMLHGDLEIQKLKERGTSVRLKIPL